ncbi:hypothetical protein PIB30_089780, partial [Stylosanthes scabra]|nr:hypothetical protein [Stylosanthes scabra]
MRILSQILGIFVSWKTRVMNMDMLVIIVWVLLLMMPWIGCEFLELRTHNNHICGRTFGSTSDPTVTPNHVSVLRKAEVAKNGSKVAVTSPAWMSGVRYLK